MHIWMDTIRTTGAVSIGFRQSLLVGPDIEQHCSYIPNQAKSYTNREWNEMFTRFYTCKTTSLNMIQHQAA